MTLTDAAALALALLGDARRSVSHGQVQLVLLAALVLAPAVAVLARHLRWHVGAALAATVALVGGVVVPLARPGLLRQAHLVASPTCALTSPTLWTSDALLNLCLLLPLGLFATLATRRPGRVLAGCAALSALVEAVQATTATGTCDSSDLVHNTAGAAVGVLAGVLLLALRGPVRSVPRALPAR